MVIASAESSIRYQRSISSSLCPEKFGNGPPRLEVQDFGKAEDVLSHGEHLALRAKIMRTPAVEWSGWLGRYHAALEETRRVADRQTSRER
jgi:hypothetical protein